ncbi:MAG TPA: zinc ribbon domain-containing protein [Leptolyngbyaceae cyanobacterium M33_DOE_097]|uniref:Uncharacterized protein n=1 Tax=Oscillatoriales cyanobacterium SpSt-418 TaxID=2282169 RepID=A0A7C3KH57_9CYAN|nr:zinc ribbon domain-containing protein [Leptolyngbyaceae cyanobacterium M33_DOE_097]
MPECPRCHQSVSTQAVTCPYCRTPLKAYGHPGIPLHRADKNEYLCATCVYDDDNTCTFPQRPYAKECTLYCDRNRPVETKPTYTRSFLLKSWLRRNSGWFLLAALILLSLLWAISQ